MGWWDELTGKAHSRRWQNASNSKREELVRIWNASRYSKKFYIDFTDDGNAFADAKYGAGNGWFQNVGYKVIQVVVSVVVIIVGLVLSITGTGVPAVIAGVSSLISAVGLGFTSAEWKKQTKRLKEKLKELEAQSKKTGLSFKQKQKIYSEALTQNIIYTKYDIYATGDIYNAGMAGDMNTFNPQKAYDANKGILGQNIPDDDDEISDKIMKRAHASEAGNIAYTTSLLSTPTQAASDKGIDYGVIKETYQNYLEVDLNEMNAVFGRLFEAGFGLRSPAATIYQNAYNYFVGINKTRIDSAKFLEQMQSYRNAVMPEFDFKTFYRDETAQRMSEFSVLIDLINEWDSEEEINEREQMEEMELVYYIINKIKAQILALETFCEGSFRIGWEGISRYEIKYTQTSEWSEFLAKIKASIDVFEVIEKQEKESDLAVLVRLQSAAKAIIKIYQTMPQSKDDKELVFIYTTISSGDGIDTKESHTLKHTIANEYIVYKFDIKKEKVRDSRTGQEVEQEVVDKSHAYALKMTISSGQYENFKKALDTRIGEARFEKWLNASEKELETSLKAQQEKNAESTQESE